MQAFLDIFTWERFLTLWGLVAPAISASAAYLWSAKQNRESREFAQEQWARQVELEEKRRTEEEERNKVVELHEKMEKAYSAFLAAGLRIRLNLLTKDSQNEGLEHTLLELNEGYHQLLLVASSQCAQKAVPLWETVIQLTKEEDAEVRAILSDEIRPLRAAFLKEARKDLEDPIARNSNPGITIKPALSAGGFHLNDVG